MAQISHHHVLNSLGSIQKEECVPFHPLLSGIKLLLWELFECAHLQMYRTLPGSTGRYCCSFSSGMGRSFLSSSPASQSAASKGGYAELKRSPRLAHLVGCHTLRVMQLHLIARLVLLATHAN